MVYIKLIVLVASCATLFNYTNGHGMMLSPPGRSSRWRYNSSAPINYDDNANYCGGFSIQWYSNDGNCGLCGDNYADATPRANELGGKYGGSGVIVETFQNTYTATVGFQITANHLGYTYLNLCNLDKFDKESEECFNENRLKFADGSDKFYIGSVVGWIDSIVVLPAGLSCQHCVLRWTYNAGNNWGICENGTAAIGCGPQENFKSCADIRIVAPSRAVQLPTMQNKINDEVNLDAEIPIIIERKEYYKKIKMFFN